MNSLSWPTVVRTLAIEAGVTPRCDSKDYYTQIIKHSCKKIHSGFQKPNQVSGT